MTKMAEPPSPAVKEANERSGVSRNKVEEHVIPKNHMGIVFFSLMCTMFLVALDQTITTTALPTIVAEIGGGKNYSWVGRYVYATYNVVCNAIFHTVLTC